MDEENANVEAFDIEAQNVEELRNYEEGLIKVLILVHGKEILI